MNRSAPKKRSSIFLDSDSSSSNDNDASSEDDSSFHDNDNICTQPQPQDESPFKIQDKRVRNSNRVGSMVMNFTTAVQEQTIISPARKKPCTVNIVSDIKPTEISTDEGGGVVIIEPTRKPSKLRLKLKMNRSSSQTRELEQHQSSTDAAVSDLKQPEKKVIEETVKKSDALVIDLCIDDDQYNTLKISNNAAKRKIEPKVIEEQKPAATEAKEPAAGVKRKKRKVAQQHDVGASSSPLKGTPKTPATVPTQASKEASKTNPNAGTATATATVTKQSKAASPPKPKKKKKTFQEQVLLHMMTTMKPFTLKSLAAELRTTDIALRNLMLSLLDKKVVMKKEFGNKVKKELYWADLENATKELYGKNVPTAEDRQDAKTELQQVLSQEKELLQVLKGMESDISNEELDKTLEAEEKVVQELKARVQEAKDRINGKTPPAAAQKLQARPIGGGLINQASFAKYQAPPKKLKTKKELKMSINHLRNEWKMRKEKCIDFIDNLSDAMEKRPKDVYKLLEIETDEMMGVKIPPKQVLDN